MRASLALLVLVEGCRCAPEPGPAREPQEARSAERTTAEPRTVAERKHERAAADTPEDAAAPEPEDARPPPLVASSGTVALEVEGFGDAVVAIPFGARERRPVLVALHGNYDRPEWQCEEWSKIVRGRGFVLCPRGVPRGDAPKSHDRWTYGALGRVEKELLAGLDALAAKYPQYVDEGPVLYTGFSLGAILGVHLMRKHPKRFRRAVLTEGGYKGWSYGLAKRWLEGGGERVLFACAQTACKWAAKSAASHIERAGGEARVAFPGNLGHTYGGAVSTEIVKEWQWLTAGDARWKVEADE